MLQTLSDQERAAVTFYDERIRSGDVTDNPLWADGFTYGVFQGHPDGPIVDIGCGIGRAIDALDDYGARGYLGIDPSEASVAYCQQTFSDLEFEVGEVRLLGEKYPARFGGFLMFNVLMHTPKADLSVILQSLRQSLLTGAPGLMNAGKPSMAKHVSDAAKGLAFSYYEQDQLVEALESHGFLILDIRDGENSFMIKVLSV